ncbi:MAG TPA: phosphate signaling complex protein PhoU [Wenzhouxiangella sp.]
MEEHFHQHISRQFNQELEDLRKDVMTMGGLAEQMIADAITALIEGESARAEQVIENDHQVNQMEKQIDQQCIQILARRQPTASDLRLVMAIIKTVNDLERVGDEAEQIAKMAIRLVSRDRPRGNYRELETMGTHVRAMIRDALNGFARLEPEVAIALKRQDQKVDSEYEAILRQYYSYLVEEPRNTSRILDSIWVARSLERIGDHAKNIGEYIVYMVEGKDIRRASAEEIEQSLGESD